MASTLLKKDKTKTDIAVAAKMKDYSKEPAFKRKAEEAIAFIKKNGLPKSRKKAK